MRPLANPESHQRSKYLRKKVFGEKNHKKIRNKDKKNETKSQVLYTYLAFHFSFPIFLAPLSSDIRNTPKICLFLQRSFFFHIKRYHFYALTLFYSQKKEIQRFSLALVVMLQGGSNRESMNIKCIQSIFIIKYSNHGF